jgi:hypothetical protein
LRFPDLIKDVGGLCSPIEGLLKPCNSAALPPYIPQIDHGSRRDKALREQIVSVPLTALVRKARRGGYVVRFSSADTMKAGLRLGQNTQVIISSVAYDQPLEDFWAAHVQCNILPQLAQLELVGMTVPNFSFMKDVPRPNSLYNLTRIYRVAERMTNAGIPTILHLQASSRADWRRWHEALRDQPQSKCVALEFQTGASRAEFGDRYFQGLCELNEQLDGRLHPIVIAGAGRIAALAKIFGRFTVIDSTPFLKTVNRQELIPFSSGWRWRKHPTAPDQCLSSLLSTNINRHRLRMHQRAGISEAAVQQDFGFSRAA